MQEQLDLFGEMARRIQGMADGVREAEANEARERLRGSWKRRRRHYAYKGPSAAR